MIARSVPHNPPKGRHASSRRRKTAQSPLPTCNHAQKGSLPKHLTIMAEEIFTKPLPPGALEPENIAQCKSCGSWTSKAIEERCSVDGCGGELVSTAEMVAEGTYGAANGTGSIDTSGWYDLSAKGPATTNGTSATDTPAEGADGTKKDKDEKSGDGDKDQGKSSGAAKSA